MALAPATEEDFAARARAAGLKQQIETADPATLKLLLTEARSHHGWQQKPVDEAQLRALYDIAKWGPTSMNQQPARYLFLTSENAREQLRPCLMASNVEKTMTAPVVAIICYDEAFYENLPQLFPAIPHARDMFAGNAALARENAIRNGTLQGAYFMIAARAVGLDCGPISGFDREKVDQVFFEGTTWKTNFICCLGYGEADRLGRRMPRLEFETVTRFL